MRLRTFSSILILFACIICIPAVQASAEEMETVAKSYDVPEHGTLELMVPESWRDSVKQPPENLPPTIRMESDDCLVLITPLWNDTGREDAFDRDAVRGLLESDGEGMLPSAVETELEVKELACADGFGYYFTLTDKAPAPGDYRYATRCGITVGEMLLSVTILSDSADSTDVAYAFKMLQGVTVSD